MSSDEKSTAIAVTGAFALEATTTLASMLTGGPGVAGAGLVAAAFAGGKILMAKILQRRLHDLMLGFQYADTDEDAELAFDKLMSTEGGAAAFWMAYRMMLDAVDPCVVLSLGRLVRQYTDKPADAFFRGTGRMLSDLSLDEWNQLLALLRMSTRTTTMNGDTRLELLHSQRPSPPVVHLIVRDNPNPSSGVPAGELVDKQVEIEHAERLFYLVDTYGLGKLGGRTLTINTRRLWQLARDVCGIEGATLADKINGDPGWK